MPLPAPLRTTAFASVRVPRSTESTAPNEPLTPPYSIVTYLSVAAAGVPDALIESPPHDPAEAVAPVNVIGWSLVPAARSVPCTARVSPTPCANCTTTPGWTVSVEPVGTTAPVAHTT